MLPRVAKVSKQAVADTTRDMILTILETQDIVIKPGSATSQSIIMAAHSI